MRCFIALLPLLGFVTAQMHGQMGGQMGGHQAGGHQMGGQQFGGMGHQDDPFFNDFGAGTGSRRQPQWAAPPGKAVPMAGPGMIGQSQSSTQPPHHNPIPAGGPQVANNNPYANADQNAQGGNSGGMAGFGEADVFHAHLAGNAGRGGAQPAAAPGGVGTGQSSGKKNMLVDYNMYDLVPPEEEKVSQDGNEGEAGIQIEHAVDPDTGVGPASTERINPNYFDGLGVPGGGYRGPVLPNGQGMAFESPDIPKSGGTGNLIPIIVGGGTKKDPNAGGEFGNNLLDDEKNGNQAQGTSVGTVVGVTFGFVFAALVIGAVAFYVKKKRRHNGYRSSI